MNKKIIKVIVAFWSIFISLDNVLYFFAQPNKNWQTFPWIGVLLLVIGVLIFIPRLEKFDRMLLIIASGFFVYFTVIGVIGLVNIVASTELGQIFTFEPFKAISSQLKTIFFSFVPALLGVFYLTRK